MDDYADIGIQYSCGADIWALDPDEDREDVTICYRYGKIHDLNEQYTEIVRLRVEVDRLQASIDTNSECKEYYHVPTN